ncbi:hypothetical protein TcWFU_010516 [Taenia crassiceps]|uniref:Uncharacterized protein n=1 Tax=Taenia crassiceps TaxID=6207 RepID=A0ABR4Q9T8_9CEST
MREAALLWVKMPPPTAFHADCPHRSDEEGESKEAKEDHADRRRQPLRREGKLCRCVRVYVLIWALSTFLSSQSQFPSPDASTPHLPARRHDCWEDLAIVFRHQWRSSSFKVMIQLQESSSYHISQPVTAALSCFVAICLLFFLALTYTLLRQRCTTASTKGYAIRQSSYETFDSQTAAPSILLDEQFVQPPSSSCRSTTLSPIHEIHSESLRIPVLPLRRHSAPKSIQNLWRSEKRFLYRPVNSCIQFSQTSACCPTLHLSISYVHTVELFRMVVDEVTGLPPLEGVRMIYTLKVRIISRSRTSAYLSKPMVTPAVPEYPKFDHLFEYAVSLQRLERARIEAKLYARPWTNALAYGRRRYTLDAIPSLSSSTSHATSPATNGPRSEVNLTELLREYKEVGRAELVLDTCLLRSNPTALEHLTLPLTFFEDEVVPEADLEEETKE